MQISIQTKTPAVNTTKPPITHISIKTRTIILILAAFALACSVIASPTPQAGKAGKPADPGLRVPKGTSCTFTNDVGVLAHQMGDGGDFNIVDGKFGNCAGCTKENGFGR
jgi:hypothetical protein